MGSFVPWLYYAFYCESIPKVVYLVFIAILGISCIVVSLWDKFSEPEFRAIRAGKYKSAIKWRNDQESYRINCFNYLNFRNKFTN